MKMTVVPELKICLLGLGMLALTGLGNGNPNVFLIMADDMSLRDCSPYYGQPGGHPLPGRAGAMPEGLTPNMSTLASQGMRFDACFNSTAMCAPIRQQLYTGIYPVRSGAYPNHGEVKAGTKSIVHHLTALGYRVGLMGKRHIGPQGSSGPFPFEYLGSGSDTEDVSNIAAAVEFMTRDANQPYCLIVTSNNPHGPWDHGDFVPDNTTLPIPADAVDTPQFRASYNKYLGEVKAFDDEVGAWMARVRNAPNPANTLFVCLTEHGASLPAAKFNCYDQGLRTGCLISWPAQIEAGSSTDAMIEIVDFVPTFIDAAGGAMPGGLERLDGLSFLPVLLGATQQHKQYVYGVQTSRGVNAQEAMDDLDGPGEQRGYAMRSIRDERYKLIWNLQYDQGFGPGTSWLFRWPEVAADTIEDTDIRAHAQLLVDRIRDRPEFQFYDLEVDPFELNNLFGEGGHADRIAAMRLKLEAWMRSQRDRGILTEWAADWSTGGASADPPVADELHPFDAWINQYPFLWSDERLPGADPDGDGLYNSTEWLQGTDPLVANESIGGILKGVSVTVVPGTAPSKLVDLTITRPRHHRGYGVAYEVESSETLAPLSWQAVASKEVFASQPLPGDYLESARLRVEEPNAPASLFYRINQESLAGYTSPAPLFAGEAIGADLGDFNALGLNDKSLTITVQAMLPAGPILDGPRNPQAEVLWKIGGRVGISLVLLGDRMVCSAAKGANGQQNLTATLSAGDFGKRITVRFTLEPKVGATLFELSGKVSGGGGFSVAAIQDFTSYMGSSNAKIGVPGSTLTGISVTSPFGPLSVFAVADVEDWSTGSIRYEILDTVAAPLW